MEHIQHCVRVQVVLLWDATLLAAGTCPDKPSVLQVHVGDPGQVEPQWMQRGPDWEDVEVLGGDVGHQAFSLL
jgi:hypothetical protein